MTIEFVAAKCPNCGGELRVPDNIEKFVCMYCGHHVILHDSTKLDVNLVYKVDIANTLKLAQIAEEAKNYDDAYKFYSQIAENDADNEIAWLGRARCIARKPTNGVLNINEIITYISVAEKINQLPETEYKKAYRSLLRSTIKYTKNIFKYLESVQPTISDLTINGRYFEQTYFPNVYKSLNYCWSKLPNEKNADLIVDLLVYLDKRKASHEVSYAPLMKKIESKYPGKTKILEDKKCFIATAAMCNENHPYISILREYRNQVLEENRIGRAFIKMYYRFSPFFAKVIEQHKSFRTIAHHIIVIPAYRLASKKLQNRN